ncbi:MAG: OsmC family protein [Saprospiraceae bacterium]|nr:OsmC family protein [Saprospiraceae bacterium]
MKNTATVEYLGNLRTIAKHNKSGQEIITDAPVDNNGKGEAFSPTDLASTALASCMLTVMGIAARTHKINMDGAKAEMNKIMAENPRRIFKIEIDIFMPENISYSSREKAILTNAAKTCPVGKSLHPDLEEILSIHWCD